MVLKTKKAVYGGIAPRMRRSKAGGRDMDYADKKLLDKALEAVKCGTLIKPHKLSLRKMLKHAGLSDGYFRIAVGKIAETAEMSDLYVDYYEGEIDLVFDEKAFCRLQPILSSYIGDKAEVYASNMRWWNRQAETTNEIIKCFRKVPKRYICEYADKFIAKDAEFYQPLIKEAIKSKSIHRRLYSFFVRKVKRLNDYLCKRLAVCVFKKRIKEAQHGA